VLRCDGPGLPTRDSLLVDPTENPVPLKIWNRNGAGAVVGAFNARTAESDRGAVARGDLGPADVPRLSGSRFACYAHNARSLALLEAGERIELSLGYGEFELYTLVPVERGLAAIGLSDKLNSGGAISSVDWLDASRCRISIRDRGTFIAWSERAPASVDAGGKPVAFEFDAESRRLSLVLSSPGPQILLLCFPLAVPARNTLDDERASWGGSQ